MLDVVEPSRSIVLHPVGPRAVSQEEVSGLVTGEQWIVPCRETQNQWAQPWGPVFHWGMSQNPRMASLKIISFHHGQGHLPLQRSFLV